jgi:hypothetical protein
VGLGHLKSRVTQIVVSSGHVSFQSPSRFTLLLTYGANLVAVKMGLNVVFHLGFIFVSSGANITAVKDSLAISSHNSIHLGLNFFVQIQI